MKVYNTSTLNNKQRFVKAIIVGIMAPIACAFAYGIVDYLLPLHVPLLYVAMAFAIAYAIQRFGHGVQLRFSILAIACFVLSLILGYFVYYTFLFEEFHFYYITYYLMMFFNRITSFSLSGLMEWACIAYSCYIAYYFSRIL